jgi:hypothetical protein
VVALTVSLFVTLILTVGFFWYRGLAVNGNVIFTCRRPVGTPLTWGEAMIAATYVFFTMWWVYGVVPHQFLTWADSELAWRPDRFLNGPKLPGLGTNLFQAQSTEIIAGDGGGWLPFTITYRTIRDIIAVAIYGVFLAGNIAVWSLWQNRDKAVAKAEEAQSAPSTYGRPLVREGVS